MKKYILLLILGLTVSLTSKGQPYEAVYNKIAESYTINSDGSAEYRYQKEIQLNTHMSFNSLYGETFIIYNPAYQTLKINECYTKQKDGTIIKAPSNAFNPSLPSFAVDAPAYNNLTEMVVTHTGLELGCTVYLDYTITSKPGFLASQDIYKVMNEVSPIKDYQISITSTQPLTYEQTIKPGVEPQKSGNTYVWNFKNIPARLPETNVASTVSPYFFASTQQSNEARVKAITDLISKAAESTVNNYKGNPKICCITKYVSKEVGNSQIPLAYANQVRPAQIVANSAYGTSMEKAALMLSLCKSAKIPAEVVLTFPENVPPSILNVQNVFIKADDKLTSPVDGSEGNLAKLCYKSSIWNNGNEMKIKVAPETVNFKAEKNLNTDKEGLTEQANYLVYALPVPQEGFDTWMIRTLNTERKQDLEIPNMLNETCEYAITLPEGTKLSTKPYSQAISNKVGDVKLQLSQDGNVVKVIRTINLNQEVVPTSDYAQFRALVNLWNNPAYKSIVIKK